MSQIQVELQETMGSDESICHSAWTSSSGYKTRKNKTSEDIYRVIKMLADNKHSTPFESVILRFWIKMPIAVDRQFMTHRIQSSSGMSGRYRTMPSEYLDIPEDVSNIFDRLTSKWPNKTDTVMDPLNEYINICEHSNNFYRAYITTLKNHEKAGEITNAEFKRMREFFRGVLPQHNMTERVSIMNLRAFANFIKLRNSPHAQPEIKKVAELMLKAVKDSGVCPIAIENLENNAWIM